VFILCTTESHKIPATIASRCQHFSFRSVEFDDLIERMAWICKEEGIDADTEALAVIAQAGEGSVRDSLSALDQAIACCGTKLEPAEVRSLLGAFSLDAMSEVTAALTENTSGRMLKIVDELERNGQNLQHFSRELSRYFRNLLVAKISGAETRLIAASPNERKGLEQVAGGFSEEDLTRYLQLALNLFGDLQYSLQPRFHLEIGLLKMVQAGRLVEIEQAIANLGAAPAPVMRTVAAVAPVKPAAPAPAPVRMGPSPFEMDRAKKAALPPSPAPVSAAGDMDWREKLHGALTELKMTFTADAVEHSSFAMAGGVLQVTAPLEFKMMISAVDLVKGIQHLGITPPKINISFGEVAAAPQMAAKAKPTEDEATREALANPEIQRFREIFGGEVRNVRNLKE
jgi:DNA polymerase-3 subunit gamma/tau